MDGREKLKSLAELAGWRIPTRVPTKNYVDGHHSLFEPSWHSLLANHNALLGNQDTWLNRLGFSSLRAAKLPLVALVFLVTSSRVVHVGLEEDPEKHDPRLVIDCVRLPSSTNGDACSRVRRYILTTRFDDVSWGCTVVEAAGIVVVPMCSGRIWVVDAARLNSSVPGKPNLSHCIGPSSDSPPR